MLYIANWATDVVAIVSGMIACVTSIVWFNGCTNLKKFWVYWRIKLFQKHSTRTLGQIWVSTCFSCLQIKGVYEASGVEKTEVVVHAF